MPFLRRTIMRYSMRIPADRTMLHTCQTGVPRAIGSVDRVSPGELKCMSEKQKKAMTLLLCGEQGARRTSAKPWRFARPATIST